MSNSKAIIAAIVTGVGLVLIITLPIVLTLPESDPVKSFVDLVEGTVEQGPVVGVLSPEAGIFWGIPFSKPPVNDLRWRKPEDPLPFTGAYWNATYKRPGCPQSCSGPAPEYSCPLSTNEDCLYLNVWVPKKLLKQTEPNKVLENYHYELDPDYLPGGNKKPLEVMVWFYGGNFVGGAGSVVLYDGRFMASKGDVIVVTTNYRLSYLGYLVQGENDEGSKGNFGIWDQVKTLNWVKSNIANFGGNPNRVTIFGQSAGAESIGIHLTSDISKDLFHQAIMESNPFGLPFRTVEDARKFGDTFAEAADCSQTDIEQRMNCLRSKSLDELKKANDNTGLGLNDLDKITILFQPWAPVIDGDVVPKQPVKLFMEGKEQKKPMMMGATVDEAMSYVEGAFQQPMNASIYKLAIRVWFKADDYPKVIEQYPPVCDGFPADTEECDNRFVMSKLATDYLFQCPQRRAANSTLANRWVYKFNETWSFYEIWGIPLCYDRVCHAAELAYLYGIETLTVFSYTNGERKLSNRMIAYWTNFAKTGDPRNPEDKTNELLDWPGFLWSNTEPYKALEMRAEGDLVVSDPYKENCDFWDQLDAYAEHYY